MFKNGNNPSDTKKNDQPPSTYQRYEKTFSKSPDTSLKEQSTFSGKEFTKTFDKFGGMSSNETVVVEDTPLGKQASISATTSSGIILSGLNPVSITEDTSAGETKYTAQHTIASGQTMPNPVSIIQTPSGKLYTERQNTEPFFARKEINTSAANTLKEIQENRKSDDSTDNNSNNNPCLMM